MTIRVLRFAAALLAAVVMPLGASSATVTYAPPAGNLPAGRYHGRPYDAVLPSGRLVTPAGSSVVTGMDALGLALTPDGRYAIASNGDERDAGTRSVIDPDASGGYSLSVIDTVRMVATMHYRTDGETYYGGVAVVRDPRNPLQTLVFAAGGPANAVYVFDLDGAGRLSPDARHTIAIPGREESGFADRGISFPCGVLAAPDGRHVYVVNAAGDSVAAIDVANRRLAGAPHRVGFSPFGIALAGSRLLVTNQGLLRYATLPAAAPQPSFGVPAADPADASSLSILALDADGGIAAASQAVAMDQPPDGLRVAGGAHPTAIVTTGDGAYAFVAMTNVDRIATVALGATPHVVGGTELRLFDRGPYGTQPTALALSRDGSRLYVALTGLDAVAVIDAHDPPHLHRLGLIPTGWAPSALALSSDDRTLFVTNQFGLGHDASYAQSPVSGADADAMWSTLQRIDLGTVNLAGTTRAALGAARNVVRPPAPLPKALHNVVLIVTGAHTYDEVFGDLGRGPGDAAYATAGAAQTPNLHALARRFGVAGNFYADPGESTPQVLTGGLVSAYSLRTAPVRMARRPLGYANQDPEDALRLGDLFTELARRNLSYRDYGGMLDVSGTTPQGYTQNVPASAALAGHVDANYSAWSIPQSSEARAAEFVKDFGALARAKRQPRFAYVALPGDADGALGTILDFLSHLPSWRTTVAFVVPAGAGAGRDHVDASRTYALVASPYAKRGYVGMRHLSAAAVLKTIDRIYGLPPLSLGDLLAADMSDFFAKRPDLRPFTAASPAGVR